MSSYEAPDCAVCAAQLPPVPLRVRGAQLGSSLGRLHGCIVPIFLAKFSHVADDRTTVIRIQWRAIRVGNHSAACLCERFGFHIGHYILADDHVFSSGELADIFADVNLTPDVALFPVDLYAVAIALAVCVFIFHLDIFIFAFSAIYHDHLFYLSVHNYDERF
ncbi:hypothetical protein BD414DRAFT_536694 [Trametes punicea]|nr:hypothetical protein BD414DRAFT_536694 [Trametes punicea]